MLVSTVSHWPVLTDASDTMMLRHVAAALVAPGPDAVEFTSLCDAAREFGRCFCDAGAPPEKMVIALKETLATSYGSVPSLDEGDDAVANMHNVAPSARWYPLALTGALEGYFESIAEP